MDYSDLRRDFGKYTFNPENAPELPNTLFTNWIEDAKNAQIEEFNAMVISTVRKSGRPSSRIVLLKSYSEGHFYFFTNYNSRKGKELQENPNACLLFFWKELERQIRIEGKVEKISYDQSNLYFKSRPIDSQLSALASPQSSVIGHILEVSKKIETLKVNNKSFECPSYWGGYKLIPDYYEFWQGGSHRLHQRLSFTAEQKKWVKKQLAP